MDAATALDRLARAPVGHLGTVTPEGRPHVVPCCFVVVGERAYSVVDAKPKTTLALRRLANIAAHRDVTLLVDRYDEAWSDLWWVRIDARAEIWESGARRRDAVAALAAKYRQYREADPPGPVIAMEITGWHWWP